MVVATRVLCMNERGVVMFTWSKQIYNLCRFIPKLRDSSFAGWVFYGCATCCA